MRRLEMFSVALIAFPILSVSAVSTADETPTVDAVIKRYVKALGGEMRLLTTKAIKVEEETLATLNATGETFSYSNEIIYKQQKYFSRKIKPKPTLKRNSLDTIGFDGKRKWSGSGRILNARFPYHVRNPLGLALLLRDFSGKLKVIASDDISKNDIRFEVTPPTPTPASKGRAWPTEFRFDKDTGLIRQVVTANGTHTFSNYQRVNGIMIPHIHHHQFKLGDIDQTFKITIKSIEFDVEVDEKIFEVPSE